MSTTTTTKTTTSRSVTGFSRPGLTKRSQMRWAGPGVGLGMAVLAVLVLLPFGASAYQVGLLGRILAFGLFAASLDLLVGVAGLPSLGHAAFFGIGAYTAALTARDWTALGPAQLLLASVVAGAVAGLTGFFTLRSKGVYFLMLTVAIGELARQLADSWTSLTGGTNGLAGVPALEVTPGGGPMVVPGHIYWYVVAVTAAAYLLIAGLRRSPFGHALEGLRDNEDRMRSLGYSTVRLKLTAMVLAGALAGVAGSLWVTQLRFVSPAELSFGTSALALLTIVIGGRGSLPGAFAAAGIVLVVRDELSSVVDVRGPLVLGLTFIAVVYLVPGGLAGLAERARRAWAGRRA